MQLCFCSSLVFSAYIMYQFCVLQYILFCTFSVRKILIQDIKDLNSSLHAYNLQKCKNE